MKGYLLHKDGRRTEMPAGAVGCQRYYVRAESDGSETLTVYEADAEVVDGCIVYRETDEGSL